MQSAGYRAVVLLLSIVFICVCSVSSEEETSPGHYERLNFEAHGHSLIVLSVEKKEQLVLESDREFEVRFTALTGGPDPFSAGSGPFLSKNKRFESGVPRKEAIGHVYKYAAISTDGSNLIIDPHVKVM